MYTFRLFEEKDAERILQWNEGKDADFLQQWAGSGFIFPLTQEQLIEDAKKSCAVFMISDAEKIVGTIAILRTDDTAGSGYLGHYLLDPSETGKGHGTDIICEFTNFCFGVLKLKELSLRVFTFNTPALRCYEKNGFTETEHNTMDNGWEVLLMTRRKAKTVSSNNTPIEICEETEEDYRETELVAQRAFWNLHVPGCDEHLLVSNLRKSSDYIKDISKVAKIDGHVVGAIFYTKAKIIGRNGEIYPLITFGPLCVEPDYQSLGIGGRLLKTTMQMAKEKGYPGIVIYGEPGYYPKYGFKTCDHFGITTPDGQNFDAFMGYELKENAFLSMKGNFYESEVMENLPKEQVEEKNRQFPGLVKIHLPGHWVK